MQESRSVLRRMREASDITDDVSENRQTVPLTRRELRREMLVAYIIGLACGWVLGLLSLVLIWRWR